MLVLTRKVGETIRIGKDITITVVECDGNHIKLGIDAPRSVAVHREEIYRKITAENREAASTPMNLNMGEFAKIFKK